MCFSIVKKTVLFAGLFMARLNFADAWLATTTHYNDGLQGACGCGTMAGTYGWSYGINNQVYTAAANQALFDPNMEHWCGTGCGKCYRLTSTGVSSCETCGIGGEHGKSITVIVTNLCPYILNEQWCPNPGQLNPYGYAYHFDIMGGTGVFGDNVVVEFEEVACPTEARLSWDTCECHPKVSGKPLGTASIDEAAAAAAAAARNGTATAPVNSTQPAPFAPAGTVAFVAPIGTPVVNSTVFPTSVSQPSNKTTIDSTTTTPYNVPKTFESVALPTATS
ncbi:RlpA-like double-psi beta-barrel-protein domain-containing protein-containing protein [Aspergillus pseudoustus]|uniref:RlpA-like double-psi beta-barrel-protein domain-containing protein-containing protein n=1 Tax=Aspergillus pseudoustus TaxID=1810923 RepID=A0ABR4K7U1_9EURO